jgi:hypothetical protein
MERRLSPVRRRNRRSEMTVVNVLEWEAIYSLAANSAWHLIKRIEKNSLSVMTARMHAAREKALRVPTAGKTAV